MFWERVGNPSEFILTLSYHFECSQRIGGWGHGGVRVEGLGVGGGGTKLNALRRSE